MRIYWLESNNFFCEKIFWKKNDKNIFSKNSSQKIFFNFWCLTQSFMLNFVWGKDTYKWVLKGEKSSFPEETGIIQDFFLSIIIFSETTCLHNWRKISVMRFSAICKTFSGDLKKIIFLGNKFLECLKEEFKSFWYLLGYSNSQCWRELSLY